jgi:hypothetical protein
MKSKIKAACGGMLLAAVAGPAAWGQVSPAEIEQLDRAIGERVEATAVLGTQSIASRSGLGWTLNNASGDIYKIPWKFELQAPQPLGATGLDWAPVFEGGAGFAQFANHFDNNVLAGNESDFTTLALSIGGGSRLYFGSSGFSVLPAFDLLFAYTENNFTAHTPAGEAVVVDGRFVNWEVYTVSFVPSFELRYQRQWRRWTPTFTSAYGYFSTLPLSRSTDSLSFRSDSMVWANKMDLDYMTPWSLFGRPMHFGGDLGRTDLFNGLRDALATDHYYQTDGRITFDVLGKIWGIKTIGLTGGYFWCDTFHGFTIGLEGSVGF